MKKFSNTLLFASLALPGALAGTPAENILCSEYSSTPVDVITDPPLVTPADIAVDGLGDIFIVDQSRKEVIRVDATDHSSNILFGQPYLEIPIGITISPVHADLYVGDENSSTIWHIPCQTRNQNSCEKYYAQALNISLPTAVHPVGLEMDLDDHLYIADLNGHRVLKRDANTGAVTVLLDSSRMSNDAPANAFEPYDIAIDQNTNEILVTDRNNDDIWSLKCAEVSATGLSCDVYAGTANKLDLSGDGSDIVQPSGIVCDLQGDLYVTGLVDGVVARIQGNTSTQMIPEGTLLSPVSLSYDTRPTSKSIYISDDQIGNISSSSSQGLYELSCNTFTCVALTEEFVTNLAGTQCQNINVGGTCNFQCADGYSSPNATSITCTEDGWDSLGIVCVSASGGATTAPGAPGAPASDDGGVIAGVIIAVLVVVGVGVFLFIRYRQGKLVIKKSSNYSFGSAGV